MLLKKLFLILFSFFIFFLSFEIFLQLTSIFYKAKQEILLNDHFSNDQFVFVTLGESTTADATEGKSWPIQLEELLNLNHIPARVLNLAQAGSSSALQVAAYEKIQKNLPQHVVIAMLGVNELGYNNLFFIKKSNFESKTLKLIHNFYLTYKKLYSEDKKYLFNYPFSHDQNNELNLLIENFRSQKKINYFAINDFVKKNKFNTDEIQVYIADHLRPAWGHPLQEYQLSYELYDLVLKKKFNESILHPYIVLAAMFNKIDDCEFVVKKLLESDTIESRFIPNLLHCFPKKNEFLEKYIRQVNPQLKLSYNNEVQIAFEANLKILNQMLSANGHCLFLMQYPLSPIEEISKLFSEPTQNLFFIENKTNFTKALQKNKYDDLFYDHFAGNFGHTNEAGSHMIAENVVDQLKKIQAQKKCLWSLKTK